MRKLLFLFCILFFINSKAQSNFKRFIKASCPLKAWIVFHPFKAKKALTISNEATKVADSIASTSFLDGDAVGGQIDAFRHAYWMARLKQKLGKRAARSLGKAYEKDNYRTFKKRQLEDGVVPDEISSKMDLFNNDKGLSFIKKRSNISKENLILQIVNSIQLGEMKIIKKNKKGNYLTCDGKIIDNITLKGKWRNDKCLVSSKKK